MYKEFSVLLLLLTFILIPTNAFAWNDSDENKAYNEPKKNNVEVKNFEIYITDTPVILDIISRSHDSMVDTNLLYEPHTKWVDDN